MYLFVLNNGFNEFELICSLNLQNHHIASLHYELYLRPDLNEVNCSIRRLCITHGRSSRSPPGGTRGGTGSARAARRRGTPSRRCACSATRDATRTGAPLRNMRYINRSAMPAAEPV